MPKAYYSTVFDQPASRIWAVIRDFNSYAVWVHGAGESHIEDGRAGDAVGAVRNVRFEERTIRQRLLAHSDRDRCLVYRFCDPAALPVADYEATLRVTPVTDGDRAFVEWWAIFDCTPEERARWTTFYAESFATWLASLRQHLEHG